MHWIALRGGRTDPYVLARLGLHPLADASGAGDAVARTAQQIARAAMGMKAERLDAVPPKHRSWAARALAPRDPQAALNLLAEDAVEARAACLLALAEHERAADLIGAGASREAWAIRAHIELARGRNEAARGALNAMFAKDGIAPPLGAGGAPFDIDDLQSPRRAQADGPKVTVVIPYRDAVSTLETAVRSMLCQDWKNLEILLVDDRSADGGPGIAARLAAEDGRVSTMSNMRAPGVYGARNCAVEAANGAFVTFLDADDWSPAERIARQMEALGPRSLCIASHIRMDETGRPVAPRVFPLVRPVPITMLLRRETLLAAGPFDEVATGADSEMFARLEMLHGKRAVVRNPAVLLVARWRSGSLSDATEGGMLGDARHAYRAEWMFRHAGLEPPRLPAAPSRE